MALVVLVWLNAKRKIARVHRREEMKKVIEPLFRDQFAEFFLALDVPSIMVLTPEEARHCGRQIMNYLAHNPCETELFMSGLEKHRARTGGMALDPIGAARDESDRNGMGEIHLTAYRAIMVITTNNPNVGFFRKVNLAAVAMNVRALASIELIRAG